MLQMFNSNSNSMCKDSLLLCNHGSQFMSPFYNHWGSGGYRLDYIYWPSNSLSSFFSIFLFFAVNTLWWALMYNTKYPLTLWQLTSQLNHLYCLWVCEYIFKSGHAFFHNKYITALSSAHWGICSLHCLLGPSLTYVVEMLQSIFLLAFPNSIKASISRKLYKFIDVNWGRRVGTRLRWKSWPSVLV